MDRKRNCLHDAILNAALVLGVTFEKELLYEAYPPTPYADGDMSIFLGLNCVKERLLIIGNYLLGKNTGGYEFNLLREPNGVYIVTSKVSIKKRNIPNKPMKKKCKVEGIGNHSFEVVQYSHAFVYHASARIELTTEYGNISCQGAIYDNFMEHNVRYVEEVDRRDTQSCRDFFKKFYGSEETRICNVFKVNKKIP